MEIRGRVGLVLEGGGMRGVFTCGVLDCFLDEKITFPYVVGVSAGACNGLSYMSGQRGRAKYSNIDLLDKYNYIGMKYLLTQRSILDRELLYKDFPEKIIPYDFDAYRANPTIFEMVTTNCRTGRPCYLTEKDNWDRLINIAKASSSLPFVCPVVFVDHTPMLDGGIVDSIPLLRAMQKGFDRNVVVLTRSKGYRKTSKDIKIPYFIYKRFPRLRAVLSRRCEYYNRQLDFVDRMESEGNVLVIRPQRTVEVDRMEKNTSKLIALYEEGYACAALFLKKERENVFKV